MCTVEKNYFVELKLLLGDINLNIDNRAQKAIQNKLKLAASFAKLLEKTSSSKKFNEQMLAYKDKYTRLIISIEERLARLRPSSVQLKPKLAELKSLLFPFWLKNN